MKKKAALVLAALMTFGSVSVGAAEIFSDINNVPWAEAKAYINNVYQLGIMQGDINASGERVFRAKDNISYNETTVIMYKLAQSKGQSVSADVINKWVPDMKQNKIPSWAYEPVAYALENGILTRSNIVSFMNADGTSRAATREDVAFIFGRFLQKQGVQKAEGVKKFADSTRISATCLPYAEFLSGIGIMVGDQNNNFNPAKTINRAEMAVVATKTNSLLAPAQTEDVEENKKQADYRGYITSVAEKAVQMYTFEGESIILDKARDSRYFLDGKEVDYRAIYSLTSNGIIVRADVFVNSNNVGMEFYCERADAAGIVTGAGVKNGSYRKGGETYNYRYDTITIQLPGGIARSYIVDKNTDFYFDDELISYKELKEYLNPEEDYEPVYLNIYGEADVSYDFEYYVYPQARVKNIHMYSILAEKGVITAINGNESIEIIDPEGRELKYMIGDKAKYYVDGEKVRAYEFRKAVELRNTEVEMRYDDDGYIMRIEAFTK